MIHRPARPWALVAGGCVQMGMCALADDLREAYFEGHGWGCRGRGQCQGWPQFPVRIQDRCGKTLFWVNLLRDGRCVVPARHLRREPQLARGARRGFDRGWRGDF